jgi:drug/metabolite transporter (DMT)-like permease
VGHFSRQTMLVLTAWAVLNIGSGIVLFEAAGRVSGIVLSIVLALEGLGVFLIVAMLRMEEASGRRLIGLLLGLAGVVTLALARDGAGETKAWLWVLVAAIAPMLWAITDVLIAAKERASTLDPLAALGVMYLISAVLCFPLAVAQDQFFMIHPGMGSTFWLILFNAVVDAANYILFVLLIGIAGAVFGSQAAYATTLAGIFWSIILLGEVLSGAAMLALALILVGLLIVGPKSEAADLEVQFVPWSKRKAQKSVFPWS